MTGAHSRSAAGNNGGPPSDVRPGGHPGTVGWWQPPRSPRSAGPSARRHGVQQRPSRHRAAVAMAMARHHSHRQQWLPVLTGWLRRLGSWTPGWLDHAEANAGQLLTGSHRRTHRHRRVRRALSGSIVAALLPSSILLIGHPGTPEPIPVSVLSDPGHVQPVPPR